MSIRCFLRVSLHKEHSVTMVLGRSSLTGKTGFHVKCLQTQKSCHVLWKSTPLRSYVTASVNRPFVVKGNKLNVFIKNVLNHHIFQWKFSRYKHTSIIKSGFPLPSMELRRMKIFLADARTRLNSRTGIGLVAVVAAWTDTMYMYYNHYLTKLPLNDRRAFIVMRDEEAIKWANFRLQNLLLGKTLYTRFDSTWHAKDDMTKRIESIMERLRKYNPELDEFLLPGAEWNALCVDRCDDDGYSPAAASQNGSILFTDRAADLLDDDELSFFIAHEMTHVIQKNEAECESTKIFFYNVFMTVLKPLYYTVPEYPLRKIIHMLAESVKFTDRTVWEREADEFGFKFACKACYDYHKFAGAFEKIGANDEPKEVMDKLKGDAGKSFHDIMLESVDEADLACRPLHPLVSERLALLQSEKWMLKAESWRQEKHCDHPHEELDASSSSRFSENDELGAYSRHHEGPDSSIDEHNASKESRTDLGSTGDELNVSKESRSGSASTSDEHNASKESSTGLGSTGDELNVSKESRTGSDSKNDKINVSKENRTSSDATDDELNVSIESKNTPGTSNDDPNVSKKTKPQKKLIRR